MVILSAQELESRGILYRTASTIQFRNRLFVKGQTLSKRTKHVAVNLYQDYQNAGIDCFLVDAMGCLTLWHEAEPPQWADLTTRKVQAPARQDTTPTLANPKPVADRKPHQNLTRRL